MLVLLAVGMLVSNWVSIASAHAEDTFAWDDKARASFRSSIKSDPTADLELQLNLRRGEVAAACVVNGALTVVAGAVETVPVIGAALNHASPGYEALNLDRTSSRYTRWDAYSNALLGGAITGVIEGISYGWDYLSGNPPDDRVAAYSKTRSIAQNYFSASGSGACRRAIDKVTILGEELNSRGPRPGSPSIDEETSMPIKFVSATIPVREGLLRAKTGTRDVH